MKGGGVWDRGCGAGVIWRGGCLSTFALALLSLCWGQDLGDLGVAFSSIVTSPCYVTGGLALLCPHFRTARIFELDKETAIHSPVK